MLAANLLPAMYPPLPPLHSSHPGIPVAGHGAVTNLAMAGYQQHHGPDPSLGTNRLAIGGDGLPDIIHSHNVGHALPPRPNHHRSGTTAAGAVSRHQRQRQQQANGGQGRRRGGREGTGRGGQQRRRSRTQSTTSSTQTDNGRCKEPCMKCMVAVTSLRWVLVVLSILGVLFVVSGIIMAALHAVGNDFLIYALVFIGLGVVLVAVVIVAWKGTPPGSEPIHALFNIGNTQSNRRERRPRRTRRARDGQWHGGMMYPEFQYRRPPPSYAASMQAYHAQMLDAQSNNNTITLVNNNNSQENYSLPGSPPPSYRSRASTIHSGVHITFPPGHDSAPNSRPPTYRSRANSHQRPRLSMDDAEPSPSSMAQGDVSFAGPLMTAEDVQQIIGTSHRRRRPAGADAGHVRSASLDLARGSDVPQHQRGSSVDLGIASVTLSSNTQYNQTYMQTSGVDMLESERNLGPSPENGVQQSDLPTPSTTYTGHPHREVVQNVFADGAQRVESGSELAAVGGVLDKDSVCVDLDDIVSVTSGDRHSEPEQYNTAL